MSSTILKKIQAKEKIRSRLLSELFQLKEIVRGSFCKIKVKCGRNGCRCQKGEPHSHQRMSWREKGRDLSRAVPKEDHEWVKKGQINIDSFETHEKRLQKSRRRSKSYWTNTKMLWLTKLEKEGHILMYGMIDFGSRMVFCFRNPKWKSDNNCL